MLQGTKDEAEAPPPKRARRTAAVKAQINITPESDDDEDDDFGDGEAMTKVGSANIFNLHNNFKCASKVHLFN